MRKTNTVAALAALCLAQSALLTTVSATELTTTRVAWELSAPLFVISPPDDLQRVFIVEQPGRIKILKNEQILPTPFLDIIDRVSYGGERGLLGLAFHPDYDNNGYFYVNYTNNSGNTVISRFEVTPDPDVADPGSESVILVISQPYSNHNGGMIAFGPSDGYLYIGMGDGGSGGDPQNRAQNDGVLLGKMLRIDVDAGDPYSIPPDNPFVGPGDPLDEIWAKGLRNPWRFGFDKLTGDIYIADVGQLAWEEIDFQPASSSGGENYGWRLMEGSHCYNPPNDCDPGGLTYPIHEYSHSWGCSITGGYVYRGDVIPDLQGTYFFADYCSDRIWSFRFDDNNVTELTERTSELDPGGGLSINDISSFGEDGNGELYIVDLGGEVFKIVSTLNSVQIFSIPDRYHLSQNYPNPFNASTMIEYALQEPAEVIIDIYDLLGRKVETLVQEEQPAGYQQVVWNAESQSSGMYFYRIQAGDQSEAKKMVLLK